jgi:hypothetical protein
MTDYQATASGYRRAADRDNRRARRDAQQAAETYAAAASVARSAAWLTGRPDLWEDNWTPARLEANVATWERLGDTYLRMSWRATESARFYRRLARTYDDMGAIRAQRASGELARP